MWRKGVRHEDRGYLPLTAKVIESHLRGEAHVGLYPLLDGDRCWWLAADFDKEEALFDAFMYVKAARALQVPVALEVSRSGTRAHAWVFFTSPVPAETARRLGTGLLREAMSLRGRMSRGHLVQLAHRRPGQALPDRLRPRLTSSQFPINDLVE